MSHWIETGNRIAEHWWPWIVHAGWQSAIVAVLALIVVRWGRRWPSAVRYGVLFVALVKFAIPPLAAVPGGLFSQVNLERAPSTTESEHAIRSPEQPESEFIPAEEPASERLVTTPVSPELRKLIARREPAEEVRETPVPEEADTPAATARTAPETSPSSVIIADDAPNVRPVASPTWKSGLMCLHIIGATAVLFWMAVQVVLLRWIKGKQTRITGGAVWDQYVTTAHQLGVRRRPSLYLSSDESVPYSYGVLQPAVVLPQSQIEGLSDKELRAVMAHELAHHRQGDFWLMWLQNVLFAVWWFHPLMWMLTRSLRRVREDCCDDAVLESCITSRETYCETLLAVAAGARRCHTPAVVLSAVRGHALEGRFRRIMDHTLNRRDRLTWGHRLVLLILAVLLLPGLNQAADEKPAAATSAVAVKTDNPPADQTDKNLLGTVTGAVVSASGDPVAGADVLVMIEKRPEENGSILHLLKRGKSDSDGSFAIPIPRSLVFNEAIHQRDEIQVWVSHPELGWTAQKSAGTLPAASLKLTLINPQPLVVTVLDPKGEPVSGVKVSVRSVSAPRFYGHVPQQLQDRFAAATSQNGQVRLAGMSPGHLSNIKITSETHGQQSVVWDLRQTDISHEVVTLHAAVPLRGKLVGALPPERSFDEISLRLVTQPFEPDPKSPRQYGVAEVRVNEDGTFAVPALAEGKLRINVNLPEDFPAFPQPPNGVFLSKGQDVQVTVPLKPAVRVSRQILDAETQQPVPDVRVLVSGNGRQEWFRTAENGQFVAYLAPYPDYSVSYSPPRPLLSHGGGIEGERLYVPPKVEEHRLPPVELVRGVSLEGRVVDENGKPVKDIRVTATWQDRKGSSANQSAATSDEQGRFRLTEVHPTAELELRTYQESVAVGDPRNVTAEQTDEPLKFVVNSVKHVALSGRVTDRQGQPVANAEYKVMGAFDAGPNMMSIGQLHIGKTGEDGRFKTPAQFHPQGSYQVMVADGSKDVGESKWSKRGENPTHQFDVVVNEFSSGTSPKKTPQQSDREPSRVSLSAIVTNHDGQPVPDAKIIVWTLGERLQLHSGRQGRFQLPEVFQKGVWIFVDAEGYRFFGELTKPAGTLHRIALTREDEPSGEPLRTLADVAVTQKTLERAQFELIKFTESILGTRDEYQKYEVLRLLPQLDPDAGLDYIDDPRYDIEKISGNLTREWHQNSVRLFAAQQLIERDIPRAIATAKLLTPGTFRVYALCRLTEKLPATDKKHRDELWEAAAAGVRNIKKPSERLEALTTVGASLYSQGETQRGTAMLKEAVQLANKLYQDQLKKRDRGRDQYARARLAWELAPADLQTALKLVPEVTDNFDICRYYGNIAHQIADVNPAEAERVFEKLPNYRSRSDWGVRVCYRMAKVDYDRARKLADTIASINLRPYASGVMAQAVAEKDPEKAKELLAEAFDALEELVNSGQDGGREIYNPLIIAVCLLPVAEQVDPDRSREYFWKALSFRRHVTAGNRMSKLEGLGPDPVLGAFLSRYDREIAEILIHRDPESLSPNADDWPYFLFGGLAAIDPEAAVELVSRLPEQTEDDRKLKLEAWKQIVPLLVNRGADGWNWLQDHQYNLWQIDELDL